MIRPRTFSVRQANRIAGGNTVTAVDSGLELHKKSVKSRVCEFLPDTGKPRKCFDNCKEFSGEVSEVWRERGKGSRGRVSSVFSRDVNAFGKQRQTLLTITVDHDVGVFVERLDGLRLAHHSLFTVHWLRDGPLCLLV